MVNNDASRDIRALAIDERFSTILADPPWRFANRTGKMAPEHRRLARYGTMSFEDVYSLPVGNLAAAKSHLYLWVPNALIGYGLEAMSRWGFAYKTNLVWYKIRKDGGPDGRGVGFYFRNVTELVLFGVRGGMRTLPPGRREVNLLGWTQWGDEVDAADNEGRDDRAAKRQDIAEPSLFRIDAPAGSLAILTSALAPPPARRDWTLAAEERQKKSRIAAN